MTVEPLIKHVSENVPLSNWEADLIRQLFVFTRFQKNTVLVKENTVTQKLYFLNKGFIRTSCLENGEETTTHIAGNNTFITGFKSFATGTVAEETLKCVTDCEVFYITKTDYDLLYQKSENWRRFCKGVYEKYLIITQQRTKDILTLSAEKHYLKLVSDQPELIQNLPIQHIASYIGIKPESLSRIRKKISS